MHSAKCSTITWCLMMLVWGDPAHLLAEEPPHWPGWRGPARDGWAGQFRPPAEWPTKLRKIWGTKVGTGYASPLLAGDNVFQHAREGNEEVVWCLDLQTGRVNWRQSYETPFVEGMGAAKHGKGPKSTPALADGRLFTMSITGVLSAWDTSTGEPLWQKDFGERYKPGRPYWGVATSPLVFGDTVITHFGSDRAGALMALNVETGKQVWVLEGDGPSYASPILVEIQGTSQIVNLTMKVLMGVDVKTGQKLWEHSYPQVSTDQNMITPVFHKGIIMQGGENRGIAALKPMHSNGQWTVQQLWHQKEVALDMSTPVVNGDLLFGMSHYQSGQLFCLDIESGRVLWRGPGRVGENVAFLSLPGYVVALMDDGHLQIVASQGDKLETVAQWTVGDSATWAPPVMVNGRILVKDKEMLRVWAVE